MATEVRRDNFKSFWDKYAGQPNTNSMMLNNNADELEELDRADILASLPILTNKEVVDIGAGIGRFTTVLAETAKWVMSTDFIESFVARNRERNAHLGNINYQVGDAVNLKMNDTSVDLVFTNWLMMYLSDSETVEFIHNCMRWLRPYGYVHLRESCSEPSTGRTTKNTMHDGSTNPTHYRFSSLYINLLRSIRYRDEDGKLWRFDLHWSCSVPTYIKRQNNWRQVHWLSQKVPADLGDKETSFNELLDLVSSVWKKHQLDWDAKLDNEEFVWTDKIFSTILSPESVSKNSTVFVYTPRLVSPFVHVNSFLLAEQFQANVWNAETVPEYYRTSLTKANTRKDQRVRFGWNENLQSSLNYWKQRDASFDLVVATELLRSTTSEELKELTTILTPGSRILTLEPNETGDESQLRQLISDAELKVTKWKDVTADAHEAQKAYFEHHKKDEKSDNLHWFLIEIRL
ncbi:hypothetical protein WR25_01328 [Diploscapter pachys]|uniref:phosphoethanolamine N-methyltransferase n=1 Tax=Diploscapter pachys TaxID=2018661 RepID=A0A2A2JA72_9BILA|nr:hypothetical protein WR25_01328 [Diploscapter pachys]